MLSPLFLKLRLAVFFALSLLATACVAQTTINVGPGQAYTTIQSGIDAASNGDTVLVAPGTYNENIDFKGKAITVTTSGGAATATLDGGSVGPAVTFKSGETRAAVLSGFTIQHGGIQNTFEASNGGVFVSNSSPSILNNILTQNNCWTIASNNGAPLIQGNEISATQDAGDRCSIGGGAGVFILGNLYGGNAPVNGIPALILDNTIENNVESGLEDSGGNGGAGIAVWGGSPVIMNNTIRNNSSPGGNGGGINLESGQGVAVVQNLIYGNSAGCGGGALAISTSTDPRTGISALVANNTIVDNVGPDDGGSSQCITISQIYPSPDTYGASSPDVYILNNVISGSTTYPAVNCGWMDPVSESDQPTFANDILYNAGGPFFGSYCIDVSDKDNNVASDPQFVNPTAQDYHLKSTSPAIDSGQDSVIKSFLSLTGLPWTTDFDGKPRVQNATGKGCTIDMGAYEYPGTDNNCGVSETLTSSLNPAFFAQSVTFTAQLSGTNGTPTGTIQFLDGANILATQTVSSTGSAIYTTSTLAVGSHAITANYQPSGSFSAATASLTQVINGYTTGTALTCAPATISVYNTAQFTATVTSSNGTPTGSISFTDNGATLESGPLLNGASSLTYTGSVIGTHSILATYTPTGAFAASSATCSETVTALPTTSILTVSPATSSFGSPVTLAATVSPATLPGPSAPTGSVTFYNGAASLGTGNVAAGVATLNISSLPAGSYNLTCVYGGSSIYASSNCAPVPVIVNAAPTALAIGSSSNPASFLTAVTFTVRLTISGQPAAAGIQLQLSINGQTISLTTDSNGSANYSAAGLTPNSYPVTVSFAGSKSLLASTASLTQVIAPAASTIALTGAPNPGDENQPVTLTATIAPMAATAPAAGTVTFYDGATSIGSAIVSATGAASVTVTFATLGVHNLTAAYSGDADLLASTSAVYQETINAGDFTITTQPGSAALYTGQLASMSVDVASLRGFNQALALTCAGLPANTTCTFSPSNLPDGQGTATLLIQTTAPQQAGSGPSSGSGAITTSALLGALALLLPGWRRRRRLLIGFSALLFAVAAATAITGCSAPTAISGGTPPGTYQVAVTATTAANANGLTHASVVTLKVQSLF